MPNCFVNTYLRYFSKIFSAYADTYVVRRVDKLIRHSSFYAIAEYILYECINSVQHVDAAAFYFKSVLFESAAVLTVK